MHLNQTSVSMEFVDNQQVLDVLHAKPKVMIGELLALRTLIIKVAKEESITLEESLKWGQASYISKQGSTVRIGQFDNQYYALYVHCQTQLIETYKEIYKDIFRYSGKRGLLFAVGNELPVVQLKHCIAMALRYHQLKHLPLLGN